MSNTVLKELKDGVLLLTLNRPEKKNAFSTEQWQALTAELYAARENQDVVVVVLTGAGTDFSAGQDLGDPGRYAQPRPFRACERALVEFDKPLIGAARGVAVGGGATILFHSDLLYVGESLRMRLPFVSLAIAPEFASTYLLPARVGARRAAEIILTGEWIGADRAVADGIATGKFKDDELLEKTLAKAAQMAELPMGSLREAKKCLKAVQRSGMEAALYAETETAGRLTDSPEFREAMAAFKEKRKPDFRNLKRKKPE